MTENLEKEAGFAIDIEEAEKAASEDVVAQREEALAKQLAEMKKRKKKLVDPLQFEMSIQAEDLSGYVPSFGWEMAPPSDKQISSLEKLGISADQIEFLRSWVFFQIRSTMQERPQNFSTGWINAEQKGLPPRSRSVFWKAKAFNMSEHGSLKLQKI